MTKKEMIKTMQLKEAALWLAFRETYVELGQIHQITSRKRSEWCTINSMLVELKIVTDHTLPDNQKAFELMMQVARDARMAEELEQADFDSRDVNS
jgi:hypothetical protein